MKHEHDPILQLGGIIRCRKCGEILPEMTEEITTVTSRRRAEKILQEIAVAGKYRADRFEGGFVVYSRTTEDNEEEVQAQKKEGVGYRVIKHISRLLGSDKKENN